MERKNNMDKRKFNGGKREGAGRPKKLEDPVTLGFRIERRDKDALKNKFGDKLSGKFLDWIRDLLK